MAYEVTLGAGKRASSKEETWELLNYLAKPEKTSDEALKEYGLWADTYAQDLTQIDYRAPALLSDLLVKHVPEKEARILDVAAGTGIIGEAIKKKGYTDVDAIDGCHAMLDRARSKNIYKNYIHSRVGTNRLPIDNDTYKVIVTSGSFLPGHLNHECFPELIRISKPGGFIFIVFRAKHLTTAFFEGFEEALQKYIQIGAWELLERRDGSFYMDDVPSQLLNFRVLDTKIQQ